MIRNRFESAEARQIHKRGERPRQPAPDRPNGVLERREAERQELAYAIVHDLSQPLTTISGFADLLERRYGERLDVDADEFIDFIRKGAARLEAMFEDLGAYLRIGDQEPPAAPVDCSRLVQAVVDSLARQMAETRATVTVEPLPGVRGDAAQIGEVFRELITNALKFSNRTAPRVGVFGKKSKGETCFAVTDNGPGIDSAQSERVFELFQHLHRVDSYPGTGVGLAICRKVVERHGGRIWVESSKGGSSFQFTIPDPIRILG